MDAKGAAGAQANDTGRPSGAGAALFLLAHNDDEFFAAPAIMHEKKKGAAVRAAFLTHGSAYGTPSLRRMAESARAFGALGVMAEDVLALGEKEQIFDMELCSKMDAAATALEAWLVNDPPERIYTHAWEGGHPDHDAAHLLGVHLAKRFGLEENLFEFPCYGGGTGPLARVMTLPPGNGAISTLKLTPSEGARALALARCFPSQWKSLIGLIPEASLRLILFRRAPLRRVPERDYHSPPRPGRLFYERRYHVTFAQFTSRAGERFLRP